MNSPPQGNRCGRLYLEERDDDVAVDEILESIVENGLNQDLVGAAIAKRIEVMGREHWKLLTFGHRAAAVYKGAAKHPKNCDIKLTLKMGLRNVQEVDPKMPEDVCEWVVKHADKFGNNEGACARFHEGHVLPRHVEGQRRP